MGVARIYSLATPFTEAEIATVGYEQSVDVLKLTHLNHNPQVLRRYSHALWTLEEEAFGTVGVAPTGVVATPTTDDPDAEGYSPQIYSYVVTSVDGATGQESLQSAAGTCSNDLGLDPNLNTVTWDAVAGADLYNIYREVNGIYGYIGGSVGLAFIDNNILPDLSDTPPGDFQPFADDLAKPAVVTFHEQRAFYARTYQRANAVYASQSADFNNFNTSRPAKSDDAVSFGIAAKAVNAIQNILSLGKVLLLFTTDAVWSVRGTSGKITPSDIDLKVENYRGASRVRPVPVDEMAFFNTNKGNAIRTIGYQFERDGYRGNDITVFAPHFFKGFKTVDMCWSEEPSSTLWVLRSDGRLLALTWQAEQDVWGWSLCYTDGVVESICSVTEDGEDILYAVIQRTVGDAQVRMIERLATSNYAGEKTAVFLDSSRTYVGDVAYDEFRGMDHLEGRTVWALADGGVVKDLIVTGGKVTLPREAKVVIIGLPFEAWLRTLPIVGQDNRGSISGRKQQAVTAIVSVIRSRGVEIGQAKTLDPNLADAATSEDEVGEIYEAKMRTPTTPYGAAPSAYTGDLEQDLGATDWDEVGVIVRSREPVPMTVVGMSVDNEVGG